MAIVRGMGAVLLVLCIIGIAVTLLIAALVPTVAYFSAATPGAYDDWVEDHNSREEGDTFRVRGKVASKEYHDEEAIDFKGWEYKFVGTDKSFYSTNNIGETGDFVLVDLTMQLHQWWIVKILIPWVTLNEPYQFCGLPCCCTAVIFLAIALASVGMTIFGGGKKKKKGASK